MPETISDLAVEQMALGERPSDPAAAARVAEIAASNDEILRAYPPERMREQILRRAQRQRRAARAIAWSLAATATVAAFVMMVPTLDAPTERTKGLQPHLLAWRKTAGEPETLGDGARVQRGDVLQLAYIAAGARHGVIVSLDGRGQTTLHFPREPMESTRLSPDGAVLLEDAYELDDAPAFERFFFVTSDGPLDASAVVEAVQRLSEQRDLGRTGAPSVAGKSRASSLTVEKP
jgi:hypothetical protein